MKAPLSLILRRLILLAEGWKDYSLWLTRFVRVVFISGFQMSKCHEPIEFRGEHRFQPRISLAA
jgi:hypothetical protein